MARKRRRSRTQGNSTVRTRRGAPPSRHPVDLLNPQEPSALGRYLRENRELKEITLDDAVRDLRIRRGMLAAFEQGDFSLVDSPVQVRGLLRNYALYLGLDAERILTFYEASRQVAKRPARGKRSTNEQAAVPIAPRSVTDTPPALPRVTLAEQSETRRNRGRRLLTVLLLLIVTLGSLGVIVYTSLNLLGVLGGDPTAAPQLVDVATSGPPTATYTPSWTPLPPTATPLFDFSGGVGVQVEANIVQRVWLRAFVDDAIAYEGLAVPGDVLSFNGNSSVVISASNAAALDVQFNGRQQEPYGERGQPLDLTFNTGGVDVRLGANATQAPTLTMTPIPTFTPFPTATQQPLPTSTPRPALVASNTPFAPAALPATATATPFVASSPTATATASPTPTNTLTRTPSITPTPTNTATPTFALVPPRNTAQPSPTKPPP